VLKQDVLSHSRHLQLRASLHLAKHAPRLQRLVDRRSVRVRLHEHVAGVDVLHATVAREQ
jgi:hypothetical protein